MNKTGISAQNNAGIGCAVADNYRLRVQWITKDVITNLGVILITIIVTGILAYGISNVFV